ncbi:uncharacterized protein V1510DRAFT_192887 [Dipodascopsis tothii]|uniref:uncharacterized protein n=1 Tax=Dipodascopsis tothii TaxID=44089 RepID=UPI0034CFC2B6
MAAPYSSPQFAESLTGLESMTTARSQHQAAEDSDSVDDPQSERKADSDSDSDSADVDDTYDLSSSPSIADENIDFNLVYAFHAFEATAEGHANAAKGDAMVLLDDSNSYWWLVRLVKDSSIGYLPAENVETPFERLARLNKHRNTEVRARARAADASCRTCPLRTSRWARRPAGS